MSRLPNEGPFSRQVLTIRQVKAPAKVMMILTKPALRLDYRILATMIQSHVHLPSRANYTKTISIFGTT